MIYVKIQADPTPKRSGRPQKYQELREAIKNMQVGEAIEVPTETIEAKTPSSTILVLFRSVLGPGTGSVRQSEDGLTITAYRVK